MYVCEKQHMVQWQPFVIESLRAETGSHWHGPQWLKGEFQEAEEAASSLWFFSEYFSEYSAEPY